MYFIFRGKKVIASFECWRRASNYVRRNRGCYPKFIPIEEIENGS
jgi:hypothetical protein